MFFFSIYLLNFQNAAYLYFCSFLPKLHSTQASRHFTNANIFSETRFFVRQNASNCWWIDWKCKFELFLLSNSFALLSVFFYFDGPNSVAKSLHPKVKLERFCSFLSTIFIETFIFSFFLTLQKNLITTLTTLWETMILSHVCTLPHRCLRLVMPYLSCDVTINCISKCSYNTFFEIVRLFKVCAEVITL